MAAEPAGSSAATRAAAQHDREIVRQELGGVIASILQLTRRLRGVRGEQHVGRILESLAPQGWLVLHDVSTGRGNIDHIAIGPGGVLTVETKSHRGTIPVGGLNRRWLAQAWAERKQLEALIGAPADALLVFSDAYLLGKPVSRQRGVLVLPARLLAGHLAARPAVLSPERVAELHARLVEALDGVRSA